MDRCAIKEIIIAVKRFCQPTIADFYTKAASLRMMSVPTFSILPLACSGRNNQPFFNTSLICSTRLWRGGLQCSVSLPFFHSHSLKYDRLKTIICNTKTIRDWKVVTSHHQSDLSQSQYSAMKLLKPYLNKTLWNQKRLLEPIVLFGVNQNKCRVSEITRVGTLDDFEFIEVKLLKQLLRIMETVALAMETSDFVLVNVGGYFGFFTSAVLLIEKWAF